VEAEGSEEEKQAGVEDMMFDPEIGERSGVIRELPLY
jgi:hypothetical protein